MNGVGIIGQKINHLKPHTNIKNNSKLIMDLNIQHRSVKLSEENIGEHLLDLGLSLAP